MREISFVVLGKPTSWKRPQFNRTTGAIYSETKSETYRTDIRDAAMRATDGEIWTGRLRLTFRAYFKMPTGWTKWRQHAHELDPESYPSVPDLDNIVKIIGDALQGLLFEDDKQIVEFGPCGKWFAAPGGNARLEIELEEIAPAERVRPPPPKSVKKSVLKHADAAIGSLL